MTDWLQCKTCGKTVDEFMYKEYRFMKTANTGVCFDCAEQLREKLSNRTMSALRWSYVSLAFTVIAFIALICQMAFVG